MSDRWFNQEEIARAIHGINSELDTLEHYSNHITTGDRDDLTIVLARLSSLLLGVLERTHAA